MHTPVRVEQAVSGYSLTASSVTLMMLALWYLAVCTTVSKGQVGTALQRLWHANTSTEAVSVLEVLIIALPNMSQQRHCRQPAAQQ